MSQPVRMFCNGDHVFYGFGPDSTEITYMTSEHPKGNEPHGCIVVFGRAWVAEQGSVCWNHRAKLNWIPINEF